MGRWYERVARIALAALLGAGLVVIPGRQAGEVVAASSCPTATIRLLLDKGRLTCYAGRTLTFIAYVKHPCDEGCGGTSASLMRPRWLDVYEGSYGVLGTGRDSAGMAAFVPPWLGRCSAVIDLRACPFHPYQDHRVTVRARFNDPIARTCRYAPGHPPGPGFTKRDAISECNADLVVLSIGPAAPETDSAVELPQTPAGGPSALPWAVVFTGALLLAARWFPIRPRHKRSGR